MGRQISFVHEESAARLFLREIERLNGYLIIEGHVYLPSDIEEYLIKQMSSPVSKALIICQPQLSCSDVGILEGTAIDFHNCCKGNTLSRTYQIGRLYMVRNKQGQFDPRLCALFEKLRSYIRKNYLYSKRSGVYFEPIFKERYDANYFYATSHGIPVCFQAPGHESAQMLIPTKRE